MMETISDPDIVNFFNVSKQKAASLTFFVDERNTAFGEIISNAFYSLPTDAQNARVAIRITSLSIFPDVSYGNGVEIIAVDHEGRLVCQISAAYCKIRSQFTDVGRRTVLMLRAIDQERQVQYDPIVSGNDHGLFENAQIMLDIDYNDFRLLSNMRRGRDSLLIDDLFQAEKRFGSYGYIRQVFQAEIIYRIAELASFLPIAIFIIIIGWRFRSKKVSLLLGIPMLVILPFLLESIIYFYRSILNTLTIWSVTSLGFVTSVVLFCIGVAFLFFFALMMLAFQREG
jgi:hypothetical protein